MLRRNLDFFAVALVLVGMAIIEHLPPVKQRVSINDIAYRIRAARQRGIVYR